ncbi:MAG: SDR family oxidoreductase, partial [Limnohabitans sp.]
MVNESTPAALVTGASYGIGRAIAVGLAHDGWDVVVTDLNPHDLEPVVADIQGLGRRAVALALDLRAPETFVGVVSHAVERCPGLSVLVNNAGLALGLEPAHRADLDDWETMVDTNIKGLLYCTRLLLPGMVER